MGKRGPAGKPTQLRLLHGDRSDRINTDEPVPTDGDLTTPEGADLDPEVQAVWDYTVDQLEGMGLAFPADRDALLCYCEAVVAHRKASAAIARSGLLIRTSRGGNFMRNPLIQVQRDSATLVRVFAREFGLTPSSRSDIHMGGGKGEQGAGPERLLS